MKTTVTTYFEKGDDMALVMQRARAAACSQMGIQVIDQTILPQNALLPDGTQVLSTTWNLIGGGGQ